MAEAERNNHTKYANEKKVHIVLPGFEFEYGDECTKLLADFVLPEFDLEKEHTSQEMNFNLLRDNSRSDAQKKNSTSLNPEAVSEDNRLPKDDSDAQEKKSTSLNPEDVSEDNQNMVKSKIESYQIKKLTEQMSFLKDYSLVPKWDLTSSMNCLMNEPSTGELVIQRKNPWPLQSKHEHINSRGKKCIRPCSCQYIPTKEELLDKGWSVSESTSEEELSSKGKSSKTERSSRKSCKKKSKKEKSTKNEQCTKMKKPLKEKSSEKETLKI